MNDHLSGHGKDGRAPRISCDNGCSHLMPRRLSITIAMGLILAVSYPAGAAGVRNDFNGDGYSDLAIGVSSDDELKIINNNDPGTVNVLYGSATRLSSAKNQIWNQNSPGIPGSSIRTSGFGSSVASADFDGDGYADLAVGSPADSEISNNRHGEVTVMYGSANGLVSAGSQVWHQGSPNILETPEHGDRFGATLATGDFNRDGFDDLAVGVPSENLPGASLAGVVHILYGSVTGLTATNNQMWSQDSPGIAENAQGGEWFGYALASGDFDNDGFDDLAIGVPNEHSGAEPGLGAVHVLYGSRSRLTATRSQFWDQATPGVQGAGVNERFGSTLAAGDFNGDGRSDLAIGAPTYEVGSGGPCGGVNVLYGAATGLAATGNQLWTENSSGIAEQCDVQARFGLTLAAADFNGDAKDDLAIGAPWENLQAGRHNSDGAVHVLFGSANRLTATGSQYWTQDSPNVPDTAEKGDYFASTLGAGDFNQDGRADLVIGVPQETLGTVTRAGVAHVLYGSAAGPSTVGNQLWSQDSAGILGTAQADDSFGASVGH